MSITFRGPHIDVVSSKKNLFESFEEQVWLHPTKLAVMLEDQSLTYGELYQLVIRLAFCLSAITHSGDIVCQCVQRSIDMVIGILAIFKCNAVYCPISPYDPEKRRQMLMSETRAKMVLVHGATNNLFDHGNRGARTLRIDCQAQGEDACLNSANVADPCSLAFVVFTSGSTGTPKGVPIDHDNFLHYLTAMTHQHYLLKDDVILQISRDTFDAHLQEILGAVLLGGTSVLLSPTKGTHLTMTYLVNMMSRYEITYINLVPSLAIALVDYLSHSKQLPSLSLRLVVSSGEPLPRSLAGDLLISLAPHTYLFNAYGVTETTVDCTYQQVSFADVISPQTSSFIPLGSPLPNYICHVMIEEGQDDAIGELLIGGPGVFRGYLNCDTNLFEINGEMFYRTGDLVKVVDGELVYIGRRDFQVKLRGQRLETSEIEGTILRGCRQQLSACVVIVNDDRLIAYVQTRTSNASIEYKVMEICRQYLPSSMVPSTVMILDKFPLNANGKVDRSRLPSPSSFLSSSINGTSQNDLEIELQTLWCRLLKIDNVPCDANLFALGANSLLFILAINYYHQRCQSDNQRIDIDALFRSATLAEHAQILTTIIPTSTTISKWTTQDLTEGPASFAQEGIWLDEQMHFGGGYDSIAVYHIVLPFRVSSIGYEPRLFILRLKSSLDLLINKHASLRTRLYYDGKSKLHQQVISADLIQVPVHESWVKNEDDLLSIIADESTNPSHFDLTQGRVIRCHLVRVRQCHDIETMVVIFNFHHSIFDGISETLFLDDLCEAFSTKQLSDRNPESPTYLDYAQWERGLDMFDAMSFWKNHLENHQSIELPYDRRPNIRVRSGRGSSIFIQGVGGEKLLLYARQLRVTPFQLCLALYYVFLFKLTNNDDLIVGAAVTNRRRRPELASIVGMFANLIPHRLQMKPCQTFCMLTEQVQQLCHEVLRHSYLPFQTIVKEFHSTDDIVAFLGFETITASQYSLDANTYLTPMNAPTKMTPFDLSLSFKHHLLYNTLDCAFEYSVDIFDETTIETFARRFDLLVQQILHSDQRPIHTLSLLLDNERQILYDLNPVRMKQDTDCIHWEIARYAQDHSQKMAIIMEDQSLSYAETIYYAQQLAMHLVRQYRVCVNDIVCHLMERSIVMALGILAIWMSGAVYAPLNVHDPFSRLQLCIHRLNTQRVLEQRPSRHHRLKDVEVIVVGMDLFTEQHCDISILDSIPVTSNHLSHIVFTSGSTGEPKAVS